MASRESKTTNRARRLRRNLTETEKKLWYYLRGRRLGVKFRRQHPIGPYVTDFCCPERNLIIEVDGGQHAEQVAEDTERAKFFAQKGYRLLRFWNSEVMENIEGVLERIREQSR